MCKLKLILSFIVFLPSLLWSQNTYDDWEVDPDTSRFFIGMNLGAYFPNHNTAILYTGRPDVTSYGIEHIFEQPFNQQEFNNYFQAPYKIAEYTFEPRYQTATLLGMHFQYQLNQLFGFFLDFNTAQIDFEQFFTVQIEDPTNQMPGPTLERFPVIGEENRFMLNLGTQIHYIQKSRYSAYFELYGHFNNIRVQTNYIVINEIQYNIFHNNNNNPNLQPGGNGYGGGVGTGFRFEVSPRIWGDVNYHITYAEVNLSEAVSEAGLQNSACVRALWCF